MNIVSYARAPRIGRGRRMLLAASTLAVGLVGSIALLAPTQTAESAIAGTTPLLDVPAEKLVTADPSCGDYDNCKVYTLTLTNGTIFQVQANKPTNGLSLGLYDSTGKRTNSVYVDSGSSGWMNVSVQSDLGAGIGVTPVTAPGTYELRVASDYQLNFSLFAFAIPNSLAVVGTNSTTTGTFDDRTTRRISGKYTYYSDGVAFNASAGAEISIEFDKPGDSEATVEIFDSFRNLLDTGDSDGTSSSIGSYTIPYSGLYQVFVSGDTQGPFTLRVLERVDVTGIAIPQPKYKLSLKKKRKRTAVVSAVISPANATITAVSWTSSNRKIVKVNRRGKITAVRRGRATITATTQDGGKTASTTVIVKKR